MTELSEIAQSCKMSVTLYCQNKVRISKSMSSGDFKQNFSVKVFVIETSGSPTTLIVLLFMAVKIRIENFQPTFFEKYGLKYPLL